jgi:predicted AAA+ superfamily ATPase
MMSADLKDFGSESIQHRLHHGGLPPFFLSRTIPARDFQDWIDGYWAKDIQELFRLERRASFQRFLDLLLAQSGGVFEANAFAGPCEVSRPTIAHYLEALALTRVAHVVRPYSTRRSVEIVSAPRVYGFDTGFVAWFRGWSELRQDDLGVLWEHFVLNEIHARLPGVEVRYWRDKRGHEVDFVALRRGKPPVAIECKWSAARFENRGMRAFRRAYPDASGLVVCSDVDRSHQRDLGEGVEVDFVSLETLIQRLGGRAPP